MLGAKVKRIDGRLCGGTGRAAEYDKLGKILV